MSSKDSGVTVKHQDQRATEQGGVDTADVSDDHLGPREMDLPRGRPETEYLELRSRSIKKGTSVASSKSRKSSKVSTQSSIASKRAAVEAARVKLEFAKREAALKVKSEQLQERSAIENATLERKQKEIKREQEILTAQCELAVAEAELEVFSAASENDNVSSHDSNLEQTQAERTKAFVENLPELNDKPCNNLSPDAPEFIPTDSCARPIVEQFSNFLITKELLTTRLNEFSDEPESFPAWKESFQGIIQEMGSTPRAQLDLLIRYLGPKSRVQAVSLRNANAGNPSLAVARIWERLNERYGKPEMIDSALKARIDNFPKISGPRDYARLYDLSDIVNIIECTKLDKGCASLFGHYDTSIGVNSLLVKLPYNIQQKWIDRAAKYKQNYGVPYPPFSEFAQFLREISSRFNDPCFVVAAAVDKPKPTKPVATILKTRMDIQTEESGLQCILHGDNHTLRNCRTFRKKPIKERRRLLKENKVCYKCCNSNKHVFKDCHCTIKCDYCNSCEHVTAMHVNKDQTPDIPKNHGGEESPPRKDSTHISTKCTTLCDQEFSGRSCAKTILVKVFSPKDPDNYILTYAVHDDQSNRTLGSSMLFDRLGITGATHQYSLKSCAGLTQINARQTTEVCVQSIDGDCTFSIPSVIECQIPCDKSEIPTPDITQHFDHLTPLCSKIPPLCSSADIGLLIGRDLPEAHHVEQQVTGPSSTPFAQKLPLGWVIIGQVCLGQFHKPDSISAYKTHIISDTRASILEPCASQLTIKELAQPCDTLGKNVFLTTDKDEQVGMSQDDHEFLTIMADTMKMGDDGHWEAPLPFRNPRTQLPNNRVQALKRAHILHQSLTKNPVKQQHMFEFMSKIFDSGAAELAPPIDSDTECWYLPLFGVYHPRKPNKIRGVFDSSVEFQGTSLNDSLLCGPNVTNSLLGVLLRFRRDQVAVVSDIQQMFYSFLVSEEHRNFLRFFWYIDNDFTKDITEYRMRVHVFGNKPSLAIATYGLRKAVETASDDVKRFVQRDFYVDDGLTSRPSVNEAVGLVKRTQKTLLDNGGIRLHKIASNVPEVMESFEKEDLDKTLQTMDVALEGLPTQASLGLTWNLSQDSFTFDLSIPEQPFTKRGVLSTVNSIFDPLGFVSPAVITGRMLMRDIFSTSASWDELLPEQLKIQWESWLSALKDLRGLLFPRMFISQSLSNADSIKIHVFCDASEKAICAVAYVQASFKSEVHVGFVMGKSKLTPSGGTTIPRLELCAGLLAIELANIISEQLEIPLDDFVYHSDSRVVLGYLNNRKRRFYTYVANRVHTILKYSKAVQWRYVATDSNPADRGTRCCANFQDLASSVWIKGPKQLKTIKNNTLDPDQDQTFDLVNADHDSEIRPTIQVKTTSVKPSLSSRFERFSTWNSLRRAFSFLKRYVKSRKGNKVISPPSVDENSQTETFLLRTIQHEMFPDEVAALNKKRSVQKGSSIESLSPFLDEKAILRVGGRLGQSSWDFSQKHPIIIPRGSHVAKLLIHHFHGKVHHQGRVITESSIRSNGFWIVGSKRMVSSLLYQCVTCRRLRGNFQTQRMADLPTDRVTPTSPFTVVGVDVFGPWPVVTRKTRGGVAESKRWAVLFTCLSTRAIGLGWFYGTSTQTGHIAPK